MKAIDLYSGIGGWSLGLKLNGIEVINSYEWWVQAVETANKNLGKAEITQDIRQMDFSELSGKKVDIVVGSPPCTQFSYSNRGGSGDIDDGIIDLYKFFECVNRVKPKFWAMENVPRVAKVLENEIQKGGQLEEFKTIIEGGFVEVFDMSEFGLPQRRKRCISSNVDLKRLNSYKEKCSNISLREVLEVLSRDIVKDPNYKVSRKRSNVTELENEEPLNPEEQRMNWEMKLNHPVYNNMSFPEDESKPARTITATCTRVSRESLVVKDRSQYRRLSVRERATLQGFPINYKFYGSSHSNKLKMIGNAIPPKFTYLIGAAMKKTSLKKLVLTSKLPIKLNNNLKPPKTTPETQSKKYPEKRSFRYALSFLRFKSGTSFEFTNRKGDFQFKFFFGDSKNIKEINLDKKTLKNSKALLEKHYEEYFLAVDKLLTKNKLTLDTGNIQRVWIGKIKGKSPFNYLDMANDLAEKIYQILADIDPDDFKEHFRKLIESIYKGKIPDKVLKNSLKIYCGLLTCSYFNLRK